MPANAGSNPDDHRPNPDDHRPNPGAAGLPASAIPRQPDAGTPREAGPGPFRLLDLERTQRLRAEWHVVQAGFVDDPRQAVRQADGLVAKSVDLIAQAVAARRAELSGAGRRADDGARTEDLRLALRHYRTLLDRMLEL